MDFPFGNQTLQWKIPHKKMVKGGYWDMIMSYVPSFAFLLFNVFRVVLMFFVPSIWDNLDANFHH